MKVFITGASSGIGAALAEHYASLGATVGIVARREGQLQALSAKLLSSNVYYVADVRDAIAMRQAAEDFIRRYGVPDIVIANAGISSGTLTENAEDAEVIQAVLDTNVVGMVYTFQPFIKAMRERGKGSLVGIASVAGVRGLPGAGAYSASKAAAITYLESLRVEMQAFGIHVTTIAPGYIKTPMTDINQYRMPFLMEAKVAAEKFADAIEKKRRFVVIPWQMGIVARVMRMIPPVLWDKLMRNAPRKSKTQ